MMHAFVFIHYPMILERYLLSNPVSRCLFLTHFDGCFELYLQVVTLYSTVSLPVFQTFGLKSR